MIGMAGVRVRTLRTKKRGAIGMIAPRPSCALVEKTLPRQRPLKYGCAGTPQRIALRIAMGVRQYVPIRMAWLADVAVAIPRRGLRQPRGITDRAESSRDRTDVVADGLQPLQNGLPLFPIQLPQERPQSLNEGILEQRLAVGFRNEEAVQ